MNQVSIRGIQEQVKTELADKETLNLLLETTFSGMTEKNVRMAVMEGMMRGFDFRDFLNKDVYAIAYGNKYSLITSIDYMRKKAAQNGLAGKLAPLFEDDVNGRPKSCEVTVKRIVEGQERGFSAKVFLSEYTTGKNQWVTKPRTMLAKVAEMHALRMAFPEELSKAYSEDELPDRTTQAIQAQAFDLDGLKAKLDACQSNEDVTLVWKSLSAEERGVKTIVEMVRGANRNFFIAAEAI